jgi:sensor histidine kinase regulating citrate/malate metabolism
MADIRLSEVSEINEFAIHESMHCQDLNIMVNQSPVTQKVEVVSKIVKFTIDLFEMDLK